MDNILIPILSLDLQKAQQTEEEIATHRAKLAQYKATWRAAVGSTVTCIILYIFLNSIHRKHNKVRKRLQYIEQKGLGVRSIEELQR